MALGQSGRRNGVARLSGFALKFPAVTVAIWVALSAGLMLIPPSLEQVVERGTTAFLPDGAPSVRGLEAMDSAFGTGEAKAYAFIVLVNDDGLSRADGATYRRIVAGLDAHPDEVVEVQDYLERPQLRTALTSKDGKATYIPVGLSAPVGSPRSNEDVALLRSIVEDAQGPPGTEIHITGDPATVADLTTAVNDASDTITFISVGLLVLILVLIYRRLVTVLIPLATIGVALVCTRGVLSILGESGLALSSYTSAFVMAIVLGAGTDYSVFLISRFRDEYRDSGDVRNAIQTATTRIGTALVASAATVILGASTLIAAKLGIFSTTGPGMAIAVAVSLAASLTLTPVLIAWTGARIGPAPAIRPDSPWSRVGTLVAARPGRVLAGSVLFLGILAAFLPTMTLSFDTRAAQPSTTPSNIGNAALTEHFASNETLPDYILVTSKHDMRNPRDLASLNTLSRAIAKVPGVSSVRSITQPAGRPLSQARISNQLATLAKRLHKADRKLTSAQPGLNRLSDGAAEIDRGANQLAEGSAQAVSGVDQFVRGLTELNNGLGTAATKTDTAASGARELANGALQLAVGLQSAHDQAAQGVQGLEAIQQALANDVLCGVDPVCKKAREGLKQIVEAQKNQLLGGLQDAADAALRIANGQGDLADGLRQLHAGLVRAERGSGQLADGQRVFRTRLAQLTAGIQDLADGTSGLGPGINQLAAETSQLTDGLDEAGTYLTEVHDQANSADAGGFYLPASALKNKDFALARTTFLSADGKVARIQIIGETDPLSVDGVARYAVTRDAAALAIRGTTLEDADVLATGAGGLGADLQDYLDHDTRFVVGLVLLIVLLILILTLRSLLAPLYLLASVILSCAAALGLTTLFWQHLMGQYIEFNVPVIAFVLLVAVGADYNILLMSRMREGSLTLTRRDVADAVTATGPVITSAGVIFASAFVALIGSSVHGLAQTGFAVATGLLLDTFIVRTLVVPSSAALLENHNWWPTRPPVISTNESA
ncbi:MMPL family transporter [Nocardioides sp. MH1]|uniref:MMPL family transporter n=1 Tax=Nocardioides sp. MH1 TaxID=3242490 RepID=UPI00352177C3